MSVGKTCSELHLSYIVIAAAVLGSAVQVTGLGKLGKVFRPWDVASCRVGGYDWP